MRIIELGPELGREITNFGSHGVTRVGLLGDDNLSVGVMHIGAGGQIGRHAAGSDQLFVVVAGSGAVCGDDGVWQPIHAGHGAVWASGEHHTTRAHEAMTAVVIEMDELPLSP